MQVYFWRCLGIATLEVDFLTLLGFGRRRSTPALNVGFLRVCLQGS